MDPVKNYTDPELVSLLKQKDPEACDFLFKKYAGAINGCINQLLPGAGSTEELLADSFVNIFNRLDDYDPRKSRFFTWILEVTRHTAIKKVRSSYNLATVSSLNDEQQKIRLGYFSGFPVNEVAKQMNLSVDTLRGKIKNTLLRLY